ncbi:MAG: penicillin acylase family protein [Acidobacteria bacterium]|nr:penicillin acylase family protein [Acidobacteriota bacterium]
MMRRSSLRARRARTFGVAALAIALAAPTVSGVAAGSEEPLNATIRRTAYGTPHILASDYAGLGYGYGYAFAEDNLCEMADDYVTVSARRSYYFGPDAGYVSWANGVQPTNLESDFFWQKIIDEGTIEQILGQAPPNGPRREVREIARGYVAGYNKYLSHTEAEGIPDLRCKGKEWVRPITEIDVYRRFFQLMLFASSGALMREVVAAAPPDPTEFLPTTSNASVMAALRHWDGSGLPGSGAKSVGSNAYGLGKDATSNGRGMVLGNPHFPWVGPERFYQFQLTIPGKMNASGAGLFGAPLVLIGHTDNVAWSHTVSTAWRFTPYELTLVPGDPTEYVYDGRRERMTSRDVTVEAREPDGTFTERTHRFWDTRFGPLIVGIRATDSPAGPVNIFNWTPTTAYAIRDANTHLRALNQFFEMDHAQSVEELKAATDRNQGIPWVNTMSADSAGRAYYGDHSVVPHVTDDQIRTCAASPVAQAVWQLARLPILDGSRPGCEWGSDRDAVVPGIFGPSHLPILFRTDYVHNANDSYWLSNPHHPLEGYPMIIGDERTQRSLRTRVGLRMVEDRLAGLDGRLGNRFELATLQEVAFENRQYAGELLRDDAIQMCETNPTMSDVADACPVVAAWDAHDNLNSAGSVLFRRFVQRALGIDGLYTNQFDYRDPVNTPNGLNIANPQVWDAFRSAVADLRDSGIPLDAMLGEYQYRLLADGARIPIHGGPGELGNFNAIYAANDWVPGEGYPDVNYGSSFVMSVQFTDDGPVGGTWLTYSESTNPDSPHYADQTPLFSAKVWVSERFSEGEIAADPLLHTTVL